MKEVTRILEAIEACKAHAAAELLPIVYDELRRLAAAQMAREKPGQTLDATGLVHEAYLRLCEISPNIKQVFELMTLTSVLHIHTTEPKALAAFDKRSFFGLRK